jgi:Holliday junction resolvasome RuvABC endonuclease subunit
VGIVAPDRRGRLLFWRQLLLDGEDISARLLALRRAADAAPERNLAAFLAIENPAHPRNTYTARLLGRAAGVSQLAAAARGIIVLKYRPAPLRAAVPRVL